MRIAVTSVLVDNQDTALKFYTETLGFVKKLDLPLGEARWLTLVSPEEPEGTQLLLEPDWGAGGVAKTFKKALVDLGIPYTMFQVEDVALEFKRLSDLGVKFTMPPTRTGPSTQAVFDDTCGNFIQIFQV